MARLNGGSVDHCTEKSLFTAASLRNEEACDVKGIDHFRGSYMGQPFHEFGSNSL